MKRFAVIAVALAGCTSNAAAPVAETMPPVVADDGCGGSRVVDLVGKPMSEAVEADVRQRSGAKSVRVIRPGMAVTMDFRPDRLNVDVDEKNVVTGIRCG